MNSKILLKLSTLASSLLLVAAFVTYRAGAFDWLRQSHNASRESLDAPKSVTFDEPSSELAVTPGDAVAGNYANISPLVDILFGTYRCPDHEPAAFGIHERSPFTYVGHMVGPLLPAGVTGRREPQDMENR